MGHTGAKYHLNLCLHREEHHELSAPLASTSSLTSTLTLTSTSTSTLTSTSTSTLTSTSTSTSTLTSSSPPDSRSLYGFILPRPYSSIPNGRKGDQNMANPAWHANKKSAVHARRLQQPMKGGHRNRRGERDSGSAVQIWTTLLGIDLEPASSRGGFTALAFAYMHHEPVIVPLIRAG